MADFETLYKEHYTHVYRFLFNLCKDDDLAQELTNETFYQAFLSFRKFRGDSKFFTWIAAIAKHTYYKYLRKNKQTISFEELTDKLTVPGQDLPETKTVDGELRTAVQSNIAKMPSKYKDVILLRTYAQMPFSEIANALKISENSAKVIYFRAKKMLSEDLKNEFDM